MAGYSPALSPAAYRYADELEYLQAYEDVLERYKASGETTWNLLPMRVLEEKAVNYVQRTLNGHLQETGFQGVGLTVLLSGELAWTR